MQAQNLRRSGLVAQWHVGSSQTRDRTLVPCIGRQIPTHCTTREVHKCVYVIISTLHSKFSEELKVT